MEIRAGLLGAKKMEAQECGHDEINCGFHVFSNVEVWVKTGNHSLRVDLLTYLIIC